MPAHRRVPTVGHLSTVLLAFQAVLCLVYTKIDSYPVELNWQERKYNSPHQDYLDSFGWVVRDYRWLEKSAWTGSGLVVVELPSPAALNSK